MIRLAALALLVSALIAPALISKDEQRLVLLRQAQATFDRVEKTASPQLADASACVQAQAAVVAVALPAELGLIHFHKGFCQLAVAAITRNPAGFADAAAELDRANAGMMAWLARVQVNPAAPVPKLSSPDANDGFPGTERLWLGWLAWRRGHLEEAGRDFAGQDDTGWPAWIAGLTAFQAGRYGEAAGQYWLAIEAWTEAQRAAAPPLKFRLAPPVDIPGALTELGGAQLLVGDLKSAVATLDRALEAGPIARAYYYRARAHELAGETEAALADYNLASRAAFAGAEELASGEAHFYRGMLLYRRKDFIRAEDEFSNALNLEIPEALRPDASAWRHLAAVAAGYCAASRQFLEEALARVSPFFPKQEARTLAAGCVTVQGKMASRSVNKVILLGNLGKDAETKFTPSGISVSKFPLATGRRTKDQQSGEWKDVTDWHNIVLWKTENISSYLLKGKQIYLEGRIETRNYEDKDGQKKYFTEVICEAVNAVLLGGGGGGGEVGGGSENVSAPRARRPAPAASPASPPEDFNQGITDDDVPF